MKFLILKKREGQTMLITVLIMSSVMLSATVIGSYLMLNQVRQSTFSANSVQAINAADAGVECELYNILRGGSVVCDDQVFDVAGVSASTNVIVSATSTEISSTGGAAKTYRAFQVTVITGP